ncbi:MAG: hypothetical protein ACYC61_09800 [Isosphaeraceae bacterium]
MMHGDWLRRAKMLASRLCPWFDPRTRRPLVLLAVVSFGILLWPLAVDEAEALFFAIPWSGRWLLVQASMVAGIGTILARLLVVRADDSWPLKVDEDRATDAATRWMPWALRLAAVSLLIPLMRHPNGLGFGDWDFVLDKYEAIRRTILEWHQFPWWHPWCRGGFPLAAEPQIGVLSVATPFVLAFGTSIGIRVATVICVILAVEGTYRLAWHWLRDPWAAVLVALVYGLNGAVGISLAVGYIIAMSYCSLPWVAYHAFRIGERLSHGLWLGFWAAFSLLNGLQYLSLYAVVFAVFIWVRAIRVQPPGHRVAVLRNTMAAAGVFLVLSGWRLATVLLVMREDRREAMTLWDEPLSAVPGHLLTRPRPDWPALLGDRDWASFVSVTSYVGPVVFALVVVSLASRWRWWHLLALVSGWMAIGSRWWYHPSRWLLDWPFFASAHVVTRWRFLAMLGLGFAAASVIARWRRSSGRLKSRLAVALVLGVAADFLLLAWQQAPLAFSVPVDEKWFPGPPVATIVNVGDGMGYPCVMRGYGVIRGYEPMLSYSRTAPTLRKARGERGYCGEAWTAEGEVAPVLWSPNRLVFQVRPGQEVFINQNPGSWWRVNGRRAFADRLCAEPLLPFAARADNSGRLQLTIDPPGLRVGLLLHVVGAVLIAAAWLSAGARRANDPLASSFAKSI